jgi:hypothetical protein
MDAYNGVGGSRQRPRVRPRRRRMPPPPPRQTPSLSPLPPNLSSIRPEGPSHSRRGCDARRTTAGNRRPGRPSSAVAAGIDALAADRSQAVLDLLVVRRQEPRADETHRRHPHEPGEVLRGLFPHPVHRPAALGGRRRRQVIKLPAAIASLATTVRVTVPAVDQS